MHIEENTRQPGEALFALLLSLLSVGAIWKAYGIAGFEALSSPGAFPMAVSMAMLLSSLTITVRTFRARLDPGNGILMDILPVSTAVIFVFILLYAVALKPLGFLPTSLIFLYVSILMLARRGVVFAGLVSVFCLVCIYVIFRLVFSVLMPEGIVPEREILAFIGNLFGGTK